MCVRRFDDSLNSAIHNTLSRFATVFIDARAKGSAVGSCFDNEFVKGNTRQLWLWFKKVGAPRGPGGLPALTPDLQGTEPHAGSFVRQWWFDRGPGAGAREGVPANHWDRPSIARRTPEGARACENGNDPSAGSPTETLLRLLLHRSASNKGSFPKRPSGRPEEPHRSDLFLDTDTL